MKTDHILGSIVIFCMAALVSLAAYFMWWVWDYRIQEKRWVAVSESISETRRVAEETWVALEAKRRAESDSTGRFLAYQDTIYSWHISATDTVDLRRYYPIVGEWK